MIRPDLIPMYLAQLQGIEPIPQPNRVMQPPAWPEQQQQGGGGMGDMMKIAGLLMGGLGGGAAPSAGFTALPFAGGGDPFAAAYGPGARMSGGLLDSQWLGMGF